MEQSNKSKMQGARPAAVCKKEGEFYAVSTPTGSLGTGTTAAAAWKDAWDNFRGNDDTPITRPVPSPARPVIQQRIAAVVPPKFGGFSPEFRACQRMGTFGRVR